jgi:hypothetical protein
MMKSENVVVEMEGRDKGKVFHIEEMSAIPAEKWAIRAFQALAQGGIDIPDYVSGAGMAGVAIIGIRGVLMAPFHLVEPLMDEMMTLVSIVRDKGNPQMHTPLLENDIMEPLTVSWLRDKVFELHTGFSFASEIQRMMSLAAEKQKKAEDDLSDTQTSQDQSGSSSQPNQPPSEN